MRILRYGLVARLHQSLFSLAYRMHEAELEFIARLPEFARQHWGNDPPAFGIGVDVGAGLGPFAREMTRCCQKVLAVEPNKAQAVYLRTAFGNRIHVAEVAASDRRGKLYLVDDTQSQSWRRPLAHIADHGRGTAWSQECFSETIDGLIAQLGWSDIPGAVVAKIDVEGHELAVLKGMANLIKHRSAVLVVEIETRMNVRAKDVFEHLRRAGFRCFVYRRGSLHSASYEDAVSGQREPPRRFGRLWGYQSNFIFLR